MRRRVFALLALLLGASQISMLAYVEVQTAFAKLGSKGKNTVEPAQVNFETAMSKYKEHDIDGAIDAWLQSVYFSRNYYNPQAYFWLGVCYMEKLQDAKAIEALKKCCEQSVGPAAEAHQHLAEIYLRNDRLKDAEQEAYAALSDNRGHGPKAHNVLGLIKDKRGSLADAQYEFEEALGDQPWSYTEAWMNYAENMMKQKAWGSAIGQFNNMLNNKVVLKGLDYEKVFLDIGLCYLAKGDHQHAIDNWHESLNYNHNSAPAHLQLAMLLDLEQHYSAAIKEYREFVRFSQDQSAVARVKDRIAALEQNLKPADVEPQVPKPSAYMRKQQEEEEREEEKQMNSLASPSTKESGF